MFRLLMANQKSVWIECFWNGLHYWNWSVDGMAHQKKGKPLETSILSWLLKVIFTDSRHLCIEICGSCQSHSASATVYCDKPLGNIKLLTHYVWLCTDNRTTSQTTLRRRSASRGAGDLWWPRLACSVLCGADRKSTTRDQSDAARRSTKFPSLLWLAPWVSWCSFLLYMIQGLPACIQYRSPVLFYTTIGLEGERPLTMLSLLEVSYRMRWAQQSKTASGSSA